MRLFVFSIDGEDGDVGYGDLLVLFADGDLFDNSYFGVGLEERILREAVHFVISRPEILELVGAVVAGTNLVPVILGITVHDKDIFIGHIIFPLQHREGGVIVFGVDFSRNGRSASLAGNFLACLKGKT